MTGRVEFIEYWTKTQVAYVADDKFALEPRRHGYKTLPFTQYWPHTGLMTEDAEPERLYRGILHGNFDMLRAESRLASQYMDIVANSAWPTRDFRGPPGITEQVMDSYEETPGAKNFMPQNVSIEQSRVAERRGIWIPHCSSCRYSSFELWSVCRSISKRPTEQELYCVTNY
jgi:hypothetical protein